MRRSHAQSGFSLIELLVIIAVIGILASIAIYSLSGAQRKARDSERKHNLTLFRTGLSGYYDGNNFVYPTTAGGAPVGSLSDAGIFSSNPNDNPIVPEQLSSLPDTPSSDAQFQYWYDANQDGSEYLLYAQLEGKNNQWYWLDSSGSIGMSPAGNGHVDANCEAASCAW
jgi:prepilin-type N-terminal cleavage/methylation domain-containing protein